MNKIRLKEGERIDDLQRSGFHIIQDPGKFCFGMDAVLLSGFATVKPGERVIDLGCGTGIIPLLLAAKTEGKHFTGLEIQPEMAEMAARSVALNRQEERIEIINGDLKNWGSSRERKEEAGSYDVVTSNPPYIKSTGGLTNPEKTRAVSRHEICCSLEDVADCAARLLRSGGRFYMVHRPDRLPEIITALKDRHLEPKRLKFVHSFADSDANMVLIEAVKGAGRQCRVEKPIIVYSAPGQYTDEIYSVYGY